MARVIAITGASAGVGRALAREFGREKAKVALIARGRDGLEGAKHEIESAGGQAMILPLDVSDAEALDRAAENIEENFGPIDVWINNAMVSVFSPVKQMLPSEYERVTQVTYLGYVNGTLAALKRMLPRDRGIIIQVGSALAYRSIPLQSAYCAAKHAIVGFTESLRTELLHDRSHVKVCLATLPAVNTPQFTWSKSRLPRRPQPVPPIYQPEVIAQAIHFLSKHPRPRLRIGISTRMAVYAEKISPRWADKYLASVGYSSQQTQAPVSPDRRDNLWEAIPGDHGAHGPFNTRARAFSLSLVADMYRAPLVFAIGSALLLHFWPKSPLNTVEKVFERTQKAA